MTEPLLLASVLGGIVGAVLGLTGAGGGVLAMPALVMVLGLPLTDAVPVSLSAIALAAALGAVVGLRKGIVRYRAALLMAGLGVVTAPVGLWLAQRLPQSLLILLFCILMLLIAARMLRSHPTSPDPAAALPPPRNCMLDPVTGRFCWNTRCSSTLALIGCTAGLFTGMLGVGGGFLIVPAFRQFSSLSMQAASATSLAVIALVSSSTVASTFANGGQVGWVGGMFIVTTAIGMLLARSVATRIPERLLQKGLGIVIVLVAVVWLAKQLF